MFSASLLQGYLPHGAGRATVLWILCVRLMVLPGQTQSFMRSGMRLRFRARIPDRTMRAVLGTGDVSGCGLHWVNFLKSVCGRLLQR